MIRTFMKMILRKRYISACWTPPLSEVLKCFCNVLTILKWLKLFVKHSCVIYLIYCFLNWIWHLLLICCVNISGCSEKKSVHFLVSYNICRLSSVGRAEDSSSWGPQFSPGDRQLHLRPKMFTSMHGWTWRRCC